MKRYNIKPLVKWAGGKRQLLCEITPFVEGQYKAYMEPFVGGGAVLFELQPSKAIINDYNLELMTLYEVVRDHPYELIEKLAVHEENNSEKYFYSIREQDRQDTYNALSNIDKAARLVYLNRTCFNGLYRVNQNGYFNVPYGKYKNPKILDADNIMEASRYFNENDVRMMQGDYKSVLALAEKKDFVFLDPPYVPLSKTASFTSYTDGGFGIEKQIELRDECNKLRERGVPFIQTNSDCDIVRELYGDYKIKSVNVSRNINCKPSGRKGTKEVIIYYE